MSQPTSTLILASTSPRRRSLLTEYGLPHRAVSPGIDDAQLHYRTNIQPRQWTAALAYLKARAALAHLFPSVETPPRGTIVLGADTVVVKQQLTVSQPTDRDDAERIIRILQGGSHEVMTGVAILTHDRRRIFTEVARVTVGEIGDERLRVYLDSGNWRGKAGGYNLIERIADQWPITYTGDPTCIMGLPMQTLGPMLQCLLDEPASMEN